MIFFFAASTQETLRALYESMSRLSIPMSNVACGLAGIGATLYIVYRIWSAMARAEPIDVFGLLRPFAIGICIMSFNTLVIGSLNGILSPISNATHNLMKTQQSDLEEQMKKQQEIMNSGIYYDLDEYFDEDLDGVDKINAIMADDEMRQVFTNHMKAQKRWGLQKSVRKILNWLLDLLHKAAVVILDVIRTFHLIVLSIFGPIAFAISVFDGFQKTMAAWIAKYVSIYLWLPITDIYGALIAQFRATIIKMQISDIMQYGFYETETTMTLIFMLVAICGYFTIPSLAGWIIQAGSIGGVNRGVNMTAVYVGKKTAAYTGAAAGNVAGSHYKLLKK